MISLIKIFENELASKEKLIIEFIKETTKGTKWEGKVYLAGGIVRDEIMGKESKDIDIMVDSKNGGIEFAEWITKQVGNYKENSNPVIYPRFGTAKFNLHKVSFKGTDLSGIDIESVMPRAETYTKGSRKPDVEFADLKGDAERRDLTVNALFKNISTGKIIDPTGKGIDDIQKGIIRTPTNPDQTFEDDPLRMLRLIRFYSKYGWKIPYDIIKSIKKNAHKLENISSERIQEELNKMLITNSPEKAIKLLKVVDLLKYVIPEMNKAVGMKQNVHHTKDVFGHTLDVLKKTKPKLVQRLIALMHDIGKTVTQSVTPTGIHFYGHEDEGEKIVKTVMNRLKYPNELIDAVALGVKNHMRLKQGGDTTVNLSDKALRKFKIEMGEQLEDILDVIHSDNISHSDESSMPNQIDNVRKRLEALDIKVEKPNLPINGIDLINEFGLTPSPLFKKILGDITDAWYENPNLTKNEAKKIVEKYI